MASNTSDTAAVIESSVDGVISVRGELSFATVTSVLEHSRSLFAAAQERLIIDLSGVGRSDSAGLALLMEWLRVAQGQGMDILFRHVPEQMLAIARASDLEQLIPLEG